MLAAASDNSNRDEGMKLFSIPVVSCGKYQPLKKENLKIKNVELCPLAPSGRDLLFRSVRSEHDFGCSCKEKPNSREVTGANQHIHSAKHKPHSDIKTWKRNFAKAPHSPCKGCISILDVLLFGNYIN